MGAWGPGLYSSDFALDLKPTVSALARLPVPDTDVHRYASDANPGVADSPTHEDYSTFWLVLADQFAKKGIDCPLTHQRALDIIDSGADIAMMRDLGMAERDLRQRQKHLVALRVQILAVADAPKKPRKVLKKPQEYIMATGDCFAYPTQRGNAINPYFQSKEAQGWIQDGWGGVLVIEAGRFLGYLAWYRVAIAQPATSGQPTLEDVRASRIGGNLRPGTCSPAHLKRMEFERIGRFELSEDAVRKVLLGVSNVGSGDTAAMQDISISNTLVFAGGFGAAHAGPKIADLLRSDAEVC